MFYILDCMEYKVIFTDTAIKSLKKIGHQDRNKILENIELLGLDPFVKSNVKKLVSHDNSFRLRVGNYRVLFDRDDAVHIIDIVDVLTRKDAYKKR